jgi:lambda family phage portal protein
MALTFLQRLFPHAALNREIARQKLTNLNLQSRDYEGGRDGQFRRAVSADGSPQGATQAGGEMLRKYARNLDENHDLAIGVLDTLVNNVIGTGIPIQPMVRNLDGSLNIDVNQRLAYILKDWSKRPIADGITSFCEAQRLLCRSWLRDGEVLINKISGNVPFLQHSGAIPLTLQLMESDYLPYMLSATKPAYIVQGVELNRYNAPQAYYLSKSHPGDVWQQGFGSQIPNDYNRVPADQILHLKFARRINQVRGVSIFHGVMIRLEDIKDYEDSERIAARVAAAFTGFVKKNPDSTAYNRDETNQRHLEMSPGMIFDNLLPGEEIGTIDSNRPNPEITAFINGQMKRVAAGVMCNYSTIARDYEGSYSSQRQSMVEAKPGYDVLRQYFAEAAAQPIYTELVKMAMLSSAVMLPPNVDRETLFDSHIAGVAMPWIDPKKEVEGSILAINNKLISRSQVISGRGGDPLETAKQIETEVELFGEVNPPPPADEGQEDEEKDTEDAEA